MKNMEKHKNFEEFPEESTQDQSGHNRPEKLISSSPRLKNIYDTLVLLKPEELPGGEIIRYQDIYKDVKPYHSMLEFTDNVRDAVRGYVVKKIPKLKERIPSIEDLDDKDLLDALTNNWFESIDDVNGERREVLLAVAAHIVKRIEISAENKLLSEAEPEKLTELGIDTSIRDLVCELLDISSEADPLFIRFLAYSQLSGKPPETASPTGLHLPGDNKMHTIAELFPHEARFIARHFKKIVENDAAWKNRPGSRAFIRYIDNIQRFYEITDTKEAVECQKAINLSCAEVLSTGFPVLLTASTEGYYKEPYLDPELKVSVVTPESNRETQFFERARNIMADSLGKINAGEFSKNIKRMNVKSSIVLGGFGSNLTFNAVAQEEPIYHLFLNEQIRSYDSLFPSYMDMITNSREAFSDIPEEKQNDHLERMSRMSTMLHEFGHPVCPSGSPDAKRLGRKPLTIIDEVKAETLWRALIPNMVKDKEFIGNKNQWAVATLISFMQLLDDPEAYGSSAIYNLNALFEQGTIEFKEGKLSIKDIDKYFSVEKDNAFEVLSLYNDKTMTENKAAAWVKKRCTPNDMSQELISFVKLLPH